MSNILSMTGFSSSEGMIGGTRVRVEMKSLNHRFLDVKLKLPREFSSAEIPLKAALQARLSRGAIELKIERIEDGNGAVPAVEVNLALAAHYYESLMTIQKTLGLTDSIRTVDIANLPDVIAQPTSELAAEEAWKGLEPVIQEAITGLLSMREREGRALVRFFEDAMAEIEANVSVVKTRRQECQAAYKTKIAEKIRAVFEAYPIAETSVQAVLDSRISQEIAMLLDRTDIQEELTRFQNHLDHFRKVLKTGGLVGRKLDFILQEMHREINTIGNKAQDFPISEEVVKVKVRLEQVREQVMNLE